ncbi:cold-shock protein [Nocardia sp. A7]|uniref:cold-shock protein n=1 Tax=Nocardia sp. A7 TaxID=2789274 RepID=UPI00397B5709
MPTTTSPASPTDQPVYPNPHRHETTEARSWQPGHVAWFDAEKGFGFVTPDRGGPAVFCDYTAIDAPGYKTLHAGQRVIFTATDTDRGPEAVRILTYAEPATAEPTFLPRVGLRSIEPCRWDRLSLSDQRQFGSVSRSRVSRDARMSSWGAILGSSKV